MERKKNGWVNLSEGAFSGLETTEHMQQQTSKGGDSLVLLLLLLLLGLMMMMIQVLMVLPLVPLPVILVLVLMKGTSDGIIDLD